jgi:parvin
MASPSTTDTLKKEKKEESFLDKLGTIGRKKKIKEVEEVAEEGRNAIESPTNPTLPVLDPQAYLLNENEERTMLDPACREDPRLQELIKLLVNWVNDELAAYRIIVKKFGRRHV